MLNVIWPIFIIISFIYAFLVGRVDDVNQSIFDSAASAVELSITFLGTICLWNGVMKIVQETSLIEKLTKLLRPIMKCLFPNLKDKDTANKEISMNLIANILGLGNAATPLGLKAMKTMQKENEKKEFSSYESVGSESAGGAAQEKDIKTRRKNPVRTGDDSEPLVLLILLLGSGAITLCIRCFKGGNES